jgi:hypothetical protein
MKSLELPEFAHLKGHCHATDYQFVIFSFFAKLFPVAGSFSLKFPAGGVEFNLCLIYPRNFNISPTL